MTAYLRLPIMQCSWQNSRNPKEESPNCKNYEKIWADEPEMIEAKYQEIQELYPQVGFFLGQQISTFLTKQL